MLWVFGFHCFCQFGINLCVCRNQTTLKSGNTREYTVRRQIRCLSRASGAMVVVSGPSMVSVVFRVVRSASDCVCLSHASGWLRLIEVFATVPLGASCFLSCRVGGYSVAR